MHHRTRQISQRVLADPAGRRLIRRREALGQRERRAVQREVAAADPVPTGTPNAFGAAMP